MYLSMWYTRQERQTRISMFWSAASLAGAFGGILAWVSILHFGTEAEADMSKAIAHMKGVGGYNGWRWIFIIEGLLTVVLALPTYLVITNWPSSASWLSVDEKAYLHARLKADSDATINEGFSWENVMAAFKDYKCWLYGLVFHTTNLPLFTLSLFLVGHCL